MELQLYSRPGCHLCETMLEELLPLCRGRARLQVLNIDTREDWRQAYGLRVPVLCCGAQEVCVTRLQREVLLSLLAE